MGDITDLICQIIKTVAETNAQARQTVAVNYKNIHHIFRNKVEVLIPDKIEKYTFFKEDWDIVDTNETVILTKKK